MVFSLKHRDLEVLGLVSSQRGRGLYVEAKAQKVCKKRCGEEIRARIWEVAAEARAAGLTREDFLSYAGRCFESDRTPYARGTEETPLEA